jgi:hypothetical protein
MRTRLSHWLVVAGRAAAHALRRRLQDATRPAAASPFAGTFADLTRGKPELIVENALLRQQLAILRRSVKRPRYAPADRALPVLPTSRLIRDNDAKYGPTFAAPATATGIDEVRTTYRAPKENAISE